jgi:hypothetical protein
MPRLLSNDKRRFFVLSETRLFLIYLLAFDTQISRTPPGMKSQDMTQLVPAEQVEQLIHLARGEKVLLDADLAKLYGVATKALNKAVKRNSSRFPEDFMFRLTAEEAEVLRFQIGTSKTGRGGRRYLPYAFTEQGVAMLSTWRRPLNRRVKLASTLRKIG